MPSRSVAFEVNVVPAVDPFCDAFAGVGPLPTPDPASAADQVMVTLLLSHPAAFAAGDSAAVTTGPVLSRVYDACADPLLPVHLFWPLKLGEAVAVTAWTPFPAPAVAPNVQLDLAVPDCR
ncbi:MAG: hypothetical protein AUG44_19615 [Actinobacteria bacterium 13_1_20CM_3_71_11]|nr:MAG: hypothetical protein AUG44_19615 [Actinobacteria bacterium 13_1_20CM_3_71_11]